MKSIILHSLIGFIISTLCIPANLLAQLYMIEASSTESLQGPVINTEAITLFRKKDYFNFLQTDILTQVSFEFSDIQIKPEEISSPLVFGASSRNTMNIVNSQPVLQDFKSIGSPSPTLFTNSRTDQTEFSITYNYGVCMFASVRHLSQSKHPDIGEKVEFGMLNISFNRAISNPIMHINGMGSLLEREEIERGFSVEFELVNPNINLLKLSGTENLVVEQGYIGNNSNKMGANYGVGAGSGSILVEGNDILELQFRVYVKRDQRKSKYRGRWPLLRNIHPGDALLLGISFEKDYDLFLEFRPEELLPELTEFLSTEMEGNVFFNLIDYKTGLVLASKSFRENTSTVISGLTIESTYKIGFSNRQFELGSPYVQLPLDKSISIIPDEILKLPLIATNEFEYEYRPTEEKDTKLSFRIGSKMPLLQSLTSEISTSEELLDKNVKDLNLPIELVEGSNAGEVNSETDQNDYIDKKLNPITNDHFARTEDSNIVIPNAKEVPLDEEFPIAIIVGSFVEIDNADRMEQLLNSMGVQVYRGQGPVEFTRVGIKLDGKSKPEDTLTYYRQTIASDTWYLYENDRIPFNAIGFIETISKFGK